MKYQDFENAFSKARLNKYLNACNGKKGSALILYRQNIKLCQKFYGILNIFEVVLRNAINNHYKTYFADNDWIKHQLKPGGMLENHPQMASVESLIKNLEKMGSYTNDRIVSSVSLGFWTHLFSRKPFALGGKSLLQIFPSRTKGIGQRVIYNEIQVIKSFRNRIAHQEAICFDESGTKNTTKVKGYYALVVKYIRFMSFPENQLFWGLDTIPLKMINRIEKL